MNTFIAKCHQTIQVLKETGLTENCMPCNKEVGIPMESVHYEENVKLVSILFCWQKIGLKVAQKTKY